MNIPVTNRRYGYWWQQPNPRFYLDWQTVIRPIEEQITYSLKWHNVIAEVSTDVCLFVIQEDDRLEHIENASDLIRGVKTLYELYISSESDIESFLYRVKLFLRNDLRSDTEKKITKSHTFEDIKDVIYNECHFLFNRDREMAYEIKKRLEKKYEHR